ncbi:Acetyl-CoA hydrolase [Desulfatibacillum aliphaticivorans]|uniref:Acetyl-CoA hydrolase n=1 Tax=Desulfatibacillum aliphaticivorans TaxID=218208 RepID=B8FKM4_DESAL|nr:succinate CoA transferase [Desulfatibacillum aliphaticivorans]ACL01839.1 Acetyl-CoA hydrolase [Desulfatibacillum aliphaticivorans]
MTKYGPYPVITAKEAASFIKDGQTIGFSGFGAAGGAKAVPYALADKAESEHRKGRPFAMRVLTGASSGLAIDEVLAQSGAISWRAPYQTGRSLRKQINNQDVEYVDMHLSHVPQAMLFGFLGKMDAAVVEASEVTPDGRVYLTTSIGISPTMLALADKVIIEINTVQSPRLREMADIVILPPPPHRDPIPIAHPMSRIGVPYATVDPKKVAGVVLNSEPDTVSEFSQPNHVSQQIAEHLVEFLVSEMKAGRIPKELLPLQAGVGNVANGVMGVLGTHPDIPPFSMYTEVFQDSQVELMQKGRLLGASATSLNITEDALGVIVDNMDFFAKRLILRPQELSNHPGIIRRLGVIAMNTALEMDIYGNVNSSHVYGMDIMNGIGGSGDFSRNSYLAVFMSPSIAKDGRISSVVPMCPHIDNGEHSVQVVVTEQGLADLRGLGPLHRAKKIIENCAHPMYRDYLFRYIENSRAGHIPHDLNKCFELHRNLMETGSMLPGLSA